MIRIIFTIIFLVFIFSGCSKKATVSIYSTANVPMKNLRYVHLNIEGTELFEQKLRQRIPIMFLGQEVLVDDPTSQDILHIIENPLQKYNEIKDSEETKEVKYVRKVYNSDTKKYETKITYVDRIYYKRCWVDTFELGASVTTRFKRDTLVTQVVKQKCRTQRYHFFHKPHITYDQGSIYNALVTKLRDKIINYLVPYQVSYNIELEEELDVEMTQKDEESFELILERIDDSLVLPSMIDTLEFLNSKYPNSYTIHFTIGVLYEIFTQYDKALANYQKALAINPSKKVLRRIQKVRANSYNLEQIQG